MNTDEACKIAREEVEGYFEQYWKHSSVLRNWFVAYGIGALVLVVYNNGTFFKDPQKRIVFLVSIVIGISLQILLTFVNKVIHWFLYYGKNMAIFQKTRRYKWSYSISECFLVDIIVDVLTMACYVCAFVFFIKSL